MTGDTGAVVAVVICEELRRWRLEFVGAVVGRCFRSFFCFEAGDSLGRFVFETVVLGCVFALL